nr:unnamed protein product [Callosobruchus analis]
MSTYGSFSNDKSIPITNIFRWQQMEILPWSGDIGDLEAILKELYDSFWTVKIQIKKNLINLKAHIAYLRDFKDLTKGVIWPLLGKFKFIQQNTSWREFYLFSTCHR